jgi:AAA ATPase domain
VAARRHGDSQDKLGLPCRCLGLLDYREIEERAARRLPRQEVGHLLVQAVNAGEGEFDLVRVDPMRRIDLAAKELVKLTHPMRPRWRRQRAEVADRPQIHLVVFLLSRSLDSEGNPGSICGRLSSVSRPATGFARHVECRLTKSKVRAIRADTFRDVDPVRNPYAPGAGQRPPELAGRDAELAAFDIALERVERCRPERSLVLTGLRGVGKTVLLNALRSKALDRGWGTGKVEARPDTSLRRPLTGALHAAVRELSVRHRAPDRVSEVLGTLKAFGLRSNPRGGKLIERWTPAIDGPASSGRADSGDMEIDLLELLTDVAALAGDVGVGVAVFIDEMQDLTPEDVSALCASCHELSQTGAPLMVVGAGLPHLPSVLSASKSYSERLFRYVRIDRLDSAGVERALLAPAEREGATWSADALAAMGATSGGYPYFVQAYGKAAWDHAPGSPITAADVAVAAPEADAELAVGFFGSRYERATPAERDYLRAMAGLTTENTPDAAVSTTDVADVLGRKQSSLSPARDALLKKGLVYSAERGTLAFTVPHFARWLRTHPPA